MKNIFNNSYFGKPYKTIDGRKALFSRFVGNENERYAILYLEHSYAEIWCTLDGRYFDWVGDKQKFWYDTPYIVSEWHEEIDEEKLDKAAKEYLRKLIFPNVEKTYYGAKEDFKAGYRKAKSE